jgi:hypothetical protein
VFSKMHEALTGLRLTLSNPLYRYMWWAGSGSPRESTMNARTDYSIALHLADINLINWEKT